jgi:hypothetical protein
MLGPSRVAGGAVRQRLFLRAGRALASRVRLARPGRAGGSRSPLGHPVPLGRYEMRNPLTPGWQRHGIDFVGPSRAPESAYQRCLEPRNPLWRSCRKGYRWVKSFCLIEFDTGLWRTDVPPRPRPLLEQRELLMRGGAAATSRRSTLTPAAGAPVAPDGPASCVTRPADAVPLGQLTDLGPDSRLIVLASVGARTARRIWGPGPGAPRGASRGTIRGRRAAGARRWA